MDSWNQIPNTTKVYLAIFLGLVMLLCGLVAIRTDIFSVELPDMRGVAGAVMSRIRPGHNTFPTPAEADPSVTAIQDVSIYKGPDEKGATLGVLKKGRTAQVVGISLDGAWWVVKADPGVNGQGWVPASQVQAANTTGVPAIGANGELVERGTPTPAGPFLVALSNTTILAGPGADYGNIGILEAGQQAQVLGASEDGAWWVIQVAVATDRRGWVSADRVKVTNGAAAPVITPAPSADADAAKAKVRALQNLNVRSGPGMDYPKIATLKKDQTAVVTGRDPEGFWWEIKLPDSDTGRGWISKDYVVAQNASNVPVINPASSGGTSLVPAPGSGAPSLTAKVMINIRAGPGKQYQTLGQLAQGQSAEVVGVTPDAIWYAIKVTANDTTRGWVAASYVTTNNVDKVPVLH